MSAHISLDELAMVIQRSMVGFELDGISIPRDARIIADIFGEMLYYRQYAVELEALPEEVQNTIRKYLHG